MWPVLQKYTLPSFQRYGVVQGYNVTAHQLATDSRARKDLAAKQARWQKIRIIRQSLQKSSMVVWFDADVVILRTDQDIAIHLKPTDFQGLVMHQVPAEDRINPNTGVWVLRNCPEAFAFLDAAEAGGIPPGRWTDQAAVMRVLEWNCGDERYVGARPPSMPNHFMNSTAWLPTGWNQPYCDNRPNPEAYIGRPLVDKPYAVHFMAMTIADRLKYMPALNQPHGGDHV